MPDPFCWRDAPYPIEASCAGGCVEPAVLSGAGAATCGLRVTPLFGPTRRCAAQGLQSRARGGPAVRLDFLLEPFQSDRQARRGGHCAQSVRQLVKETLRLAERSDRSTALAERKGFEPSIPLPVYTLSRGAPSTTRPPPRCAVVPEIIGPRQAAFLTGFRYGASLNGNAPGKLRKCAVLLGPAAEAAPPRRAGAREPNPPHAPPAASGSHGHAHPRRCCARIALRCLSTGSG